MSTTVQLGVAVPAAVAGAAAIGLANAAQSTATHQVPHGNVLDPRLLWNLLRNRTWLVGIGATATGLGLQLLALGYGPLLLVQLLLVSALLFTTIFTAWLRGDGVERPVLVGATLCAVGLGGFLLLAQPRPAGVGPIADMPTTPAAVLLAGLVTVCLAFVRHRARRTRVLILALATGVLYGVTAGLMKLVSGQARVGLAEPLGHWAFYVALLTGVTGFLLSQNTFQAGRHVAPAVAVITIVDPLVAIGLGLVWFGESITLTPAALAGEMLAGTVIVAGVMILARHTERPAGSREYAAPSPAIRCPAPTCCQTPCAARSS
ncbi:DMT family transporter [Pseudonocardia hispaniensis]|uniref:DMT family transporter n=1 Tax=Pseudonocardia hispaniensis TaxID=904933 RepID=A0ABW1J4Y6_9PSEU